MFSMKKLLLSDFILRLYPAIFSLAAVSVSFSPSHILYLFSLICVSHRCNKYDGLVVSCSIFSVLHFFRG